MKIKRIIIILMIIAVAIIIGNINKVQAAELPSFRISLTTVDYNTGVRTTGGQFIISIPSIGDVLTYDMGTTGTDYKVGYTSEGTYRFRAKKASTGGYSLFQEIEFNVTLDSSGNITSVIGNNNDIIKITYTNTNPRSIDITIKEKKSSYGNFGIQVLTQDYNSYTKTTGALFELTIPQGGVTGYFIGTTSGTEKSFAVPGSYATYTYNLKQTRESRNYSSSNLINTNIKITFDYYGKATKAEVVNNTDVVSTSVQNGKVIITVKDKIVTMTQTNFNATISTADSNGYATTGGAYTLQSPAGYSYSYTIGSTNTRTVDINQNRDIIYKLKQNSPSHGYNLLSDTNIYVYFDATGKITSAVSNNSNVSVSTTASSISIRVKETKDTSYRSTFSLTLKTTDTNYNTVTGGVYRVKDNWDSNYRYYNIGTSGSDTNSTLYVPTYGATSTYTIEQTSASSGCNWFGNIILYITFDSYGNITNAWTNSSNVYVERTNSYSVSVTTRETKTNIPVTQNISIQLKTMDKNTLTTVTGGTYTIQPPQGSSITYTLTNGIATNTFAGLSAGTYTYTIKQTKQATNYSSISDMKIYITYGSDGKITSVSKDIGNNTLIGSFNSTSIYLEILETKTTVVQPVNNYFSMNITSQDYSTGARTTGAKYTLTAPNGSALEYNMGTTGTDSKSNISTLKSTVATYTLTQTVNSNGYNKVLTVSLIITFDSNGNITYANTNNTDVRVTSYANNTITLVIRERKPEGNFYINITTPDYSTGTLTLQTPTGENKTYTINNKSARYSDFKAPGVGKYTYKIKNVSYITGSTADINIYITFDTNGRITNVSTDSGNISGNYDSNFISIYVNR